METQGALVRGLSKLAFEAGAGLTELVESMHLNIARSPGVFGAPLEGHAPGIAGLVYRIVSGAFKLTGGAVDAALAALEPFLGAAGPSPQMDDALAALNGVMVDHLVATGNPLAIPMRLRADGEELHLARDALAARFARPSRRIVVLVHGLCLSDRNWRRKAHDHGAALARDLGYALIYLRYNSGLHVSTNGQRFADLMERLVAAWPAELEEVAIVGHSMGGLVARSSCLYGGEAKRAWLAKLQKLVFLGTPHHGAPAERAGQWIDALLGKIPYTAPFARLSRIRSAGVTDLRYGFIADEDWEGRDRHENSGDTRRIVPLPKDARSFAIAGSIAPTSAGAIVGDGLVTTASALGRHNDPERDLSLPESQRWVAPSVNHLELLNSPSVYEKMRSWLS